MTKYNVKKIENTNTMTTTLTTSCKKRDTAINRFCRFLSEYDSCFKDSLLIALMTIHFDCIVDDSKQYKAVTETDEYYMTYTECGDVYQVIIEFKHDENTTYYKSLANVSDNTKENDNDTKDTELDTNETSTHNKAPAESYIIKAYYDGKELTIPYNEYKCEECAVEYIHNLFMERAISYDTLFILYHGKHVETIPIGSVLDINDLIEYNIDDINNGLKKDCYKKVRQGFERICDIINESNDRIIICLDIHSGINVYYYTITKSNFEGLNAFKSGNMDKIQTGNSFARWLYYHTCVNSIELICWYYD